MSQERIRSFIAVDLDDEAVRERIVAAQNGLAQTGAQLKIIGPEIMHLTLRFLGEIPSQTVERIKGAMDSVRFQPFDVDFTGLGVFPNPRRINVVWVGIKRGQDNLSEIFRQLEPKLRQIGLPPDNKGFSPHMTLARVKSALNKDALAQHVERMGEDKFGTMHVTAVRLKRSILTPKGPIYTTIHEVRASAN